jgi:hypothetical protein
MYCCTQCEGSYSYQFEIEANGRVKNILHGWKHQSAWGGGGGY